MAQDDTSKSFVPAQAQKELEELVRLMLQFSGVEHTTSVAATERAVKEEWSDLCSRATEAVKCSSSRNALEEGIQSGQFPLSTLEAEWDASRTTDPLLAGKLQTWITKARDFSHRVEWLWAGTSQDELSDLDATADADRLTLRLNECFRFEAKVLEFITISRIAVSTPVLTFFRSTREAEDNAARRYYDTYGLFANFYEWGADSLRGRAAIERMNQIHGRYYIPNDGMKFVLLETAFTWLEGADRIGHRRLEEKERRGFFHSHIELGQRMNIQHLNHDFAEMHQWYRDFCQASAVYHPSKRETFELLLDRSLVAAFPLLREPFLVACRAAMDEYYLAALGYDAPTEEELRQVRAVTYTAGQWMSILPRTTFLRSMQSNPVHRAGTSPHQLGASSRSPHLPHPRPDLANGGYPEGQTPLASPNLAPPVELPCMSLAEVAAHNSLESLWTVIDGEVYDLTEFCKVHPGGSEVLLRVAGRDGTVAFHSIRHPEIVEIFRLNYRIGRIGPT